VPGDEEKAHLQSRTRQESGRFIGLAFAPKPAPPDDLVRHTTLRLDGNGRRIIRQDMVTGNSGFVHDPHLHITFAYRYAFEI
jgi:hypothetical protein